MRRHILQVSALAILLAPRLAAADYYECKAADGSVSHSVTRCARGEEQRRIADASDAVTLRLGRGAGVMQVAGTGRGHFLVSGAINGVPARMLLDTGASLVSISPSAAKRMGLDSGGGRKITLNTANGQAQGTAVTLRSVEALGGSVPNVAAVIMSSDLKGAEVLLGMSFLQHFDLNIEGKLLSVRRK